MNIFVKLMRNKKNIVKNLIIIFGAVIIYELFFCDGSKIESDDEITNSNSIQDNIQKSSENIVGISKTYDISSEGWGSGIIVSKKGYILTNEHVSGKKSSICYVIINSNEKYKAEVVWSSTEIDLSVMKVEHEFENCAKLGNSNELKIGENVYSIGSPISYDFKNSVSSGIISGINRNLELEENEKKVYMNNLIQTDISINSGNSGGALINELGEVIGVTTIKITSAESMSFSMPINVVKPVITSFENNKNFSEGTLGIMGYDMYSIELYNRNIDLTKGGVYIAVVNQNSEAEKIRTEIG